ncbi:hypothetical protein PJF56_02250 [Roseofilum sp. BLCC_M91]|uniref:Uncharacterized protein n=1 Tax=Roseofilum halophilum BLCC-M91 TaxID=3022259 RepID=A0ABT7BET2_9CYAN|nr:hypothetical protein [Roseofilum halophilum]MDJ1177677.1 hypothetical protein [Roseofilum halophilum BLCC-M91]
MSNSQMIEAGFGIQWTVHTLIGFLLSLLLIEIGERPDMGITEGFIGGAIVGLMQSMVLLPHLKHAGWWMVVSAICWGIMGWGDLGAIGWIAPRTLDISVRLIYGLWEGAKVGLVLGVGQYVLLSHQVPQAWRWILASVLDWAIALACGWALGGLLRLQFRQFLGDVMGLGCAWLIVGGLTGFALTLLLNRRKF